MNFFNMFPQQNQNKKPVDNMRLYNLLGIPKTANEKEIKKELI